MSHLNLSDYVRENHTHATVVAAFYKWKVVHTLAWQRIDDKEISASAIAERFDMWIKTFFFI